MTAREHLAHKLGDRTDGGCVLVNVGALKDVAAAALAAAPDDPKAKDYAGVTASPHEAAYVAARDVRRLLDLAGPDAATPPAPTPAEPAA